MAMQSAVNVRSPAYIIALSWLAATLAACESAQSGPGPATGGTAATLPPQSVMPMDQGAGTAAPPVNPPPQGGTAAPAGGASGGAGGPTLDAAVSLGPDAAADGATSDAGASDAGAKDAGDDAGPAAADPVTFAAGLHELFIHDACTGENPSQPDTCIHEQRVEETITFGGEPGAAYDVTLRVRGLFEPTTIRGGQTPMPEHPYFKVGGTVAAADYNQWQIRVSEPQATYWLNHYPSTGHIIYLEDFEATLRIAAGASVVVGVTDGNDRAIDNAEPGLADRRQRIEGVTDEVLDGQVLRLDVTDVVAAP